MWERDRVQELYLDQRVFVVYVKIEIYCDVEDYDQAEDNHVRAEGFNFLDQEDGQQWDQYFKNLEIIFIRNALLHRKRTWKSKNKLVIKICFQGYCSTFDWF